MRKVIGAIFFIYLSFTLSAQNEDSLFIRRIADEILMNGQAYNNLRTLTKTIGGRLAGSSQMVKAEQWGLKIMQESETDKAWLQECMVPHWVRGGKDEAKASYNAAAAGARNFSPSKKIRYSIRPQGPDQAGCWYRTRARCSASRTTPTRSRSANRGRCRLPRTGRKTGVPADCK